MLLHILSSTLGIEHREADGVVGLDAHPDITGFVCVDSTLPCGILGAAYCAGEQMAMFRATLHQFAMRCSFATVGAETITCSDPACLMASIADAKTRFLGNRQIRATSAAAPLAVGTPRPYSLTSGAEVGTAGRRTLAPGTDLRPSSASIALRAKRQGRESFSARPTEPPSLMSATAAG